MSLLLLVIILVLAVFSFIRHYRMRKQQPPGPLGFPFVGQMPFRIFQIIFSSILPKWSDQEYFRKMKEKYGDIWSIDIGGRRIVMLASVNTITQAFHENAQLFSGRSPHESFKIISEDRGLMFLDGPFARGNRKLAIKALRDLGMGTKRLESKICYEIDELIKHIECDSSTPILSPPIFIKAISNVIFHIIFDERLEYDDPKLNHFIKHLRIIVHSNSAHNILELFSKILSTKYMRKVFKVVDDYVDSNAEVMKFIAEKGQSRMKVEGEYSKPSCIFDYFWRYRYQDHPEIDEHERLLDIHHSMLDILFGGIDSVTNLLSFCCLILGQNLDIQEELRREIQSNVDDHTLISMDIKKDCPKILSFIDEAQRYFVLVYVIHRRVLETCTFKGYKIEPTDVVYADLITSLHDPELFENPDVFNPYRFMDESRTKYIPNRSVIPFGMGKRVCLGESIAVMELFLFLSKIIHRFDIFFSEETKRNFGEIFEGTVGIVHAPLDHGLMFQLSKVLKK